MTTVSILVVSVLGLILAVGGICVATLWMVDRLCNLFRLTKYLTTYIWHRSHRDMARQIVRVGEQLEDARDWNAALVTCLRDVHGECELEDGQCKVCNLSFGLPDKLDAAGGA